MRPAISRSAVCYVGSALMLATGMLALGDQPLNNHPVFGACFNCTPNVGQYPFKCSSLVNNNSRCANSQFCFRCSCSFVGGGGTVSCR